MKKRTFMVHEIVTCPQCGGKMVVKQRVPEHLLLPGENLYDDVDCPKCGGIGNVYSPVDLAEALKAFMVDVFGVGTELGTGYGVIVAKEPKEEQ